jgi:hypothetical protein
MKEESQSTHRWSPLTAFLLVIALVVLTACQPIQPSTTNAETPAATIPEVTIEVNDSEFTIPDNFPGGIVRVTVQNTGSKDLDVGFSRVGEGTSVEEVKELGQNVMENLPTLLQLVGFMASFNPVPAGGSQAAIIDFKTGQFMVDASEHVEEDTPPGWPRFYGVFTADTLVGTVEPQANLKVEMTDFAYIMPDEIKAGKQLWQYHNTGKQWHMQFLLKLAPGATFDDVMAAFAAEGEPSGPPPFEFVPFAGIAPISEGERAWLEFTLEPGNYLVGCPIPDLQAIMAGSEPQSHLAHGMHRMLTVK